METEQTEERMVMTMDGKPKWISVNERMPECGERVLTSDGGYVGVSYINKHGQWQMDNVNDDTLNMALDILWWMPLPEPPELEVDRCTKSIIERYLDPCALCAYNQPSSEVVRCKDCKWFNKIGCAITIVDDSDKPKENDYCSFAERKDGANK